MNVIALYWALQDLCDVDKQSELWRGLGKDEMWTIEESMSQLFDDSGFAREMEISKNPKYENLKKLSNIIFILYSKILKMDNMESVLNSCELSEMRNIASSMIIELRKIDFVAK